MSYGMALMVSEQETDASPCHIGWEAIRQAFIPLTFQTTAGQCSHLRLATPADYDMYCRLSHPGLHLQLTPQTLATMVARGISYQPGEPGLIPLVIEEGDTGQLLHRSYLLSRHVDDTSSPHLGWIPGGWQALTARQRYGVGTRRIMDWGGAFTLPQYGKRGSCVASLIASLRLLQTLLLQHGSPADVLSITVVGALPPETASGLCQRLEHRTGKALSQLSSADGIVLNHTELRALTGPDWLPGQPHPEAIGTARTCQHLLDGELRLGTLTYPVPFAFQRADTIHLCHGGASYIAKVA